MSIALFVNHREKSCGVQQFGSRLFAPALKSQKHNCFYIDIEHEHEFHHWCAQLQPNIVVYNYYNNSTMPWLTANKIAGQRGQFKQLSVFHEVDIWNMGFDGLIHQDPTNEDTRYINISRPIPDYTPIKWECEIPVISSFGFGLGGKGFTRIIDWVKRDFNKAFIRLNIPFAAFGDAQGIGAGNWARSCQEHLTDSPGIKLKVTHTMMDENDLLDWLAMSTLNCFLYDENYGRGISGTLDYALAAGKPIAITKSWQFKHWWLLDESCLVDNRSLCDIITQGTQNLEFFKQKWGSKAVLADWDAILDRFS